jgi:flagellar basal body-associated protein FliL
MTAPDVELEEVDVMEEEVAMEEVEATEEAPTPKKKKIGYRILSVLLLAIAVVACVLPLSLIRGSAVESQPLYQVILDVIGGKNVESWNGIPMIAGVQAKGLVYGFTVYVMLLCVVVSAVLSILGVILGNRCLTKTSAGFLTAGFLYNFIAYYALSTNLNLWALDYILVACLGVSFILYFVLCAMQTKRAWYNLLQFVLSTGALFVLAYSFVKSATDLNAAYTGSALNKYIVIGASAVMALVSLIMLIRLSCTKGFPFELVCFIFELLATAAFLFVATTEVKGMSTFTFIALAIAVVQFAIVLIVLLSMRKRPEEAEPVIYEGGPIPVEAAEPVVEEMAEPVVEEPAPVETVDYDYYNSKSFDPFIASLNAEERNQFTEIFILKYKGIMPELPDYVVGGDNKEFFSKIFLYLGQYRDRIPDGLLSKIYLFSTKI